MITYLLAKRGRPAMPFANEATYFLQSLVQGKIVAVKLLRKDQYRRVIGVVCPIHFCFFLGQMFLLLLLNKDMLHCILRVEHNMMERKHFLKMKYILLKTKRGVFGKIDLMNLFYRQSLSNLQ